MGDGSLRRILEDSFPGVPLENVPITYRGDQRTALGTWGREKTLFLPPVHPRTARATWRGRRWRPSTPA